MGVKVTIDIETLKDISERNKYGESIKDIAIECGYKYTTLLKRMKENNISTYSRKQNRYNLDGKFGVGYATNTNDTFYFDLEDYDKISNCGWYCKTTSDGHKYMENKYGGYKSFHRIIMDAKTSEYIDHVNGDTLDNRKYNLRACTNQQNAFNSKINKNNTSGFTGIVLSGDVWVASIKYNYKNIYLKSSKDKDVAIRARLEAELKYFGKEFAPQRHLFKKYNIGGISNG